MKTIVKAIAVVVACLFAIEIAFSQSSSIESVSIGEVPRKNVSFRDNQGTQCFGLTRNRVSNWFVSADGAFEAGIAKYSPNGQLLWEKAWDGIDTIAKTSTESIQHS
jgi:hypothetical protein